MNIYFSGLGGVGVGPLAEIAHDAGHTVVGSDLEPNLVTERLIEKGIAVQIGQDGSYLRACHEETPIDWFVYTAALPENHPELTLARDLGIKTAKRDELLAHIIKEKNLKLIAVSGTHGKTTTTGMFVWTLKQLGMPVSYSVGTTLPFGPSGAFDPASEYFVYECDEYDRNFLHFEPYLSLLTSVDYDHPDTYPTEDSYKEAFTQFIQKSEHTILWGEDADYLSSFGEKEWILDTANDLKIPGEHNRHNASLVVKACEYLQISDGTTVTKTLEAFPGTDRRFERLADNLYSDYGHHPREIAATLQLAHELSDNIVLVYQPHQNRRQHRMIDAYTNQFELARKIVWLPTYLTREDPNEAILSPEELSQHVTNKDDIIYASLDEDLWDLIEQERKNGALVLCMGAGTIDGWLREHLALTSL